MDTDIHILPFPLQDRVWGARLWQLQQSRRLRQHRLASFNLQRGFNNCFKDLKRRKSVAGNFNGRVLPIDCSTRKISSTEKTGVPGEIRLFKLRREPF